MSISLPLILADAESEKYLSPEEYTYWKARENRTFYIDYELMDDYQLIELCKIIIQMNMEEKDVPESELKPIYIWIHSFGGDSCQADIAVDLFMSSRIPIVTIAMGAAMSAGFMLLLAGHRRYAFKHTTALVHSGSASYSGTAEQMESFQKNYKTQLEEMKKYVLSRTSIPNTLFSKNKSKDWYLTSDELIKYGVVDKIVESFDEIV